MATAKNGTPQGRGIDLSDDNITQAVISINAGNPDPRFKFVMERLVTHLHEFTRETRLSTKEWMAAIQFLTATGQTCTNLRQEFVLLSDVLGLSLLVDSMDHPKPPESTVGTLLGPFHTDDANPVAHGTQISNDADGEQLLVLCTVKDTQGKPIQGVVIDVWETDSTGQYDTQYNDRTGPDGRALLKTDAEGIFWFNGIVPVPYPIPGDGPVGKLLKRLNRHNMRPGHMHFKFDKDGYDPLITALYLRGDPYENSDAVFGVKTPLVVDIHQVNEAIAAKHNVPEGTKLLTYDFVLVTEEETNVLRSERSKEALKKLGRPIQIVQGLPIGLAEE
ncbi:Intradiol ring-cleavage dioxygenase [Ilyonectria robusta]|uniref:Intradiol ring-cleavage dioxygenase n=1 Tax=Ilyonectria robusta TaxID=1079257 RepID=UPI001E8E4ED3|nr:Intradiol ring-cleavage dioxygenase [Ilyonectria robusta]KAH8663227.1 Intradiol ring-cleavage dioxygenase [Ilyonectria robusta]